MRSIQFAIAVGGLAAVLTGTQAIAAAASPRTARSTSASTSVLATGKASYDQWCLGCHGPMPGYGMFPPAGTFRLQQRYQGSLPAVLEERIDLQPEAIRLLVRRGVNIMPPTRRTEVTDAELEAIVAYLTKPKSRG